jgi:hypothetical protein
MSEFVEFLNRKIWDVEGSTDEAWRLHVLRNRQRLLRKLKLAMQQAEAEHLAGRKAA